jgi:hypothetical protein
LESLLFLLQDSNNNNNTTMTNPMNNAAHEAPTKRCRSLLEGLLFVAACVSLVSAPVAHAFTPDASNLGVGSHVPNKQASASPVEAEIFPASFSFQSRTTARESAVLVEWERMSELERRIEDGINYEYDPFMSDSNFVAGRNHKNAAAAAGRKTKGSKQDKKSVPPMRGVFCGYRATQEEIDRLKSADPSARF